MGSRNRQIRTIALLCGAACAGVSCARPDDAPPKIDPVDLVATPATSPAGSGVHRIVSLIPAATEILFALGSGDRLVGRTRWGVHPPEAISVPDVGDGVRPSLEAILSRDPDLVILFEGPDTEGIAARLGRLGVASLSLRHNTLSDLVRNVALLGDVVGCDRAAGLLNERIRNELKAVSEAASKASPLRVYYDVWPDPPMTIGRGSFLDSLMTIAGGQNIFGDLESASPQIGLEAIVQRDPDVVVYGVSGIAGSPGTPPGERSGWSVIRAVKEGRVATVNADLLGRLGPRVGEAARELALALHPEAIMPQLEYPPIPALCGS